MDEPQFRDLLAEHLVPMFAGSLLGRRSPSKSTHALVAYENPCVLLVKPEKQAGYRVELLRSQPFLPVEKELVALFMGGLAQIIPRSNDSFFQDLLASLPRRAITEFLPTARARRAFGNAILEFEALASQTYEGRPVTASLGLTGSVGYGPITLQDLWREDFSRVLSNGFDSMYLAGSDGRVFTLECLPPPTAVGFAPHRLGAIANWCNNSRRLALVLNRNGEVLIFKEKALQFAKRRGAWRYYPHDSVVLRLAIGSEELRQAVYESCLDVSFARTGGCVAVMSAQQASQIHRFVKSNDQILNGNSSRAKLLRAAVRVPFHKLDRRLRQELLSMDGATILTHTGKVVTSGSIVKVPAGSSGGGRRAAAVQLSKLGLAIKISADGPMTGFRDREPTFSL